MSHVASAAPAMKPPPGRRKAFDGKEGTWSARQKAREREERLGRLRCCWGCALPDDAVLGAVFGEPPCDRCGKAPCHGAIVVRDSALSASTIKANIDLEAVERARIREELSAGALPEGCP